jgi:hypothetical protein
VSRLATPDTQRRNIVSTTTRFSLSPVSIVGHLCLLSRRAERKGVVHQEVGQETDWAGTAGGVGSGGGGGGGGALGGLGNFHLTAKQEGTSTYTWSEQGCGVRITRWIFARAWEIW